MTAGATPQLHPTSASDDRPLSVEAFYRQRFADAARLVHLLTGDASIAEDLAQEVFVRVRDRYDDLDAPWAYVRAAVVNACHAHHRSRGREAIRLRLLGVPPDGGLDARELLDAVDALPFRQKAVIVLRYYEDLSEADIARTLDCRPGTVKSLASRALVNLAREIQR